MEYETGIAISRGGPPVVTEPTFSAQESMWQLNLRSTEAMESVPTYPERPGEPDCSYYIRTGTCRFGVTCRFNHPPNRKLTIAAARMKGEYPERLGQPECQYYLKTGTCKFGATCKFHHPRDKAGIAGRVSLNVLGYPLRPNEIECAYYLRTGQCKFGNTCKFHHPSPSNVMVPYRNTHIYPTMHSSAGPSQQSYPGGIANWSRASYITGTRWQGPSNYTPLMLPQGAVSVSGWNAYSGQLGSVSSPESQQQAASSQFYGAYRQNESLTSGSQGTYPSYKTGSVPTGYYAFQRDNVFPERPGQPECQFYMKTGDCKFGAVCKFHHPRERLIPPPDCLLSPIGLPLRPGEPLCIFYSRYGICKFGPSCKFDHPIFTYDLAPSPSADSPVRRMLGSSSGSPGLTLPSEGLVETGPQQRRLTVSEPRQLTSSDDNIDTNG